MHAVGIRELKAKLSEYLRRVQEGESFSVTDRGATIARLGPESLYPDLGAYDGSGMVRDPGVADIPPKPKALGAKSSGGKSYSSLLREARRKGKHVSDKETLTAALREYIRRQNTEDLIAAFGTIEFDPDWDYKKLRRIP
jgi:prevent-host-death family protein